VAFEIHAEVGVGALVVAAGHLVEHIPLRQQGDAAVGGQQTREGLGGSVINQPPRRGWHDQVGRLGRLSDRFGLAFLLLINGGLAGGGLALAELEVTIRAGMVRGMAILRNSCR
jgi:hypothetical protein